MKPHLFLCLLLALASPEHLRSANLPPGFAEVLVAQNLDPTAMALAPDGRLFLLEKNGRVLLVENGQLLPDPFLVLPVDNYNERGLSGIALHPDFGQNGYLYLFFTVPGGNHNRISRFTADGNFAVPGSETVLLDIDPMPGTIHNAGSMAFGGDGKLYVSVGDGANGDAAQSLNSLLGKVLRIEADGSIPGDNPFFNQTNGKYRAIWARGFRNSFSLSIQPGTGRIFATEVGAGTWEEVNEIQAGKNYGWPIVEGPIGGQAPPDNYMDPVHAYNHGLGCSIVGAAFYDPADPMFPAAYHGKFFFADYCQGYIKYLDPEFPATATTFATGINRPLNLLTAPDGTMYYIARAGLGGGSDVDNTATTDGTLWRVFYNGSGLPFVSVNPQPVLIPVGEGASFFTAASGNEPLTFQWQRDGVDVSGANAPNFTFPNAMLSDSGAVFRCIVSNAEGMDTTLGALLRVTSSQRPEPEIILPLVGATYRGGDALAFQGAANDPEDGALPPTALRWKIDFHHDAHSHPGLAPTTGIAAGVYDIPQTGETADNVWYRVYLTATDASGLSKTVSRDVSPVKTLFVVQSEPSELPAYVDGNFQYTPVSQVSVVGINRQVEVLASVLAGDSILLFENWSDGEANPVREFTAADDTLVFNAIYSKHPLGNGTGLRAYYYDGPEFNPVFYEPYEFTWIDTTINFDWGEGSPAPGQLGDNFWLVRWEGYVEALLDDTYDFYVLADDGVRLWVNNQMLIDQWVPQPPTEAAGTIALEGGTQYPIRLEFFEEAGGAVCQLLWSSERLGKSVIPKSQLYPTLTSPALEIGSTPLRIFPNPVGETLWIVSESQVNRPVEWSLHNALGQVALRQGEEFRSGITTQEIDMSGLPAGVYWLKFNLGRQGEGVVKVLKI